MSEVIAEARSIYDAAIVHECQRLHIHKAFPRITRKHASYERVAPLLLPYQRLRDSARKYPARDHAERAEVILRQAWEMVVDSTTGRRDQWLV